MPNSATYLTQPLIVQWQVLLQEWILNRHHVSKVIGLHAQNMITILDLTFNVIGEDLCNYFMSTKIRYSDNERGFNMSSESYEESGSNFDLDLLTTLH